MSEQCKTSNYKNMLGLYLKNMKTKKKTGGNLKTLCSLSEQCKTSNYKHMLGLSITNMKKKQEAEQCNKSNYKIMLGLSLTNMKTKKKKQEATSKPSVLCLNNAKHQIIKIC